MKEKIVEFCKAHPKAVAAIVVAVIFLAIVTG
jgi:hypothetical protein